MTTFEISPVSREDIPECVEVVRRSFMTVAEELSIKKETSPLFTGYLISCERLYFQYDVEKRPMFCAEIGGKIVGYCSTALPAGEQGEINNLSVLPEFRHHKIGEALLNHAFEILRSQGCKTALVDIVADNLRLRKWYESLGFVYIKTVRLEGYEFLNGIMIRSV